MPDPAVDWPRFTWPNYIATLDSFVGIIECRRGPGQCSRPDGSNFTPLGAEYGWNGVAWCAITQSVVCNRLGYPLHTAAVIDIERRARAGWMGLGWVDHPVVGSLACYGYAGADPARMHVGCVYEVLGRGSVGTAFRSLDGNYADRVDRWLRDEKYTRGFVTLPFAGSGRPPTPKPPPVQEVPDVKVHLYELADGGAHDLGFDAGAVLIVPEDLCSFQASPDEAWFRDAVAQLAASGTPIVAAPAGTESKYYADRGIRNVQRVGGAYIRPIVS